MRARASYGALRDHARDAQVFHEEAYDDEHRGDAHELPADGFEAGFERLERGRCRLLPMLCVLGPRAWAQKSAARNRHAVATVSTAP